MGGPKWLHAVGGMIIYALLITALGILIWIFDEARIGRCADAILCSLLLLISAFIAGTWGGENEAATGAITGLFAVIPQTIYGILVDQFDVLGFIFTIVAFTILGAVGGAVAFQVRQGTPATARFR